MYQYYSDISTKSQAIASNRYKLAIIKPMTKFRDYINNEYIKWRGNTRGTVSEFAKEIELPQSLISYWMNNDLKTPPRADNIRQIAKKLGNGIYAALDLTPPIDDQIDSAIKTLAAIIDDLPVEVRPALNYAVEQTMHALSDKTYTEDEVRKSFLENLQRYVNSELMK